MFLVQQMTLYKGCFAYSAAYFFNAIYISSDISFLPYDFSNEEKASSVFSVLLSELCLATLWHKAAGVECLIRHCFSP